MVIFDPSVILCWFINPDVAATTYLAAFVFLYVQLAESKVFLHGEASSTM